jgi:hypothetical protein
MLDFRLILRAEEFEQVRAQQKGLFDLAILHGPGVGFAIVRTLTLRAETSVLPEASGAPAMPPATSPTSHAVGAPDRLAHILRAVACSLENPSRRYKDHCHSTKESPQGSGYWPRQRALQSGECQRRIVDSAQEGKRASLARLPLRCTNCLRCCHRPSRPRRVQRQRNPRQRGRRLCSSTRPAVAASRQQEVP